MLKTIPVTYCAVQVVADIYSYVLPLCTGKPTMGTVLGIFDQLSKAELRLASLGIKHTSLRQRCMRKEILSRSRILPTFIGHSGLQATANMKFTVEDHNS